MYTKTDNRYNRLGRDSYAYSRTSNYVVTQLSYQSYISKFCHKYWMWISKNQVLSTLFCFLEGSSLFACEDVRSKIPTLSVV